MLAERKRIGDLLRDAGLVTDDQINEAISRKKPEQKLGDVLVERGYVTERQLLEALEFQLGIPQVSLYNYPIDEQVLDYVPKEVAQKNVIMPLKLQDNSLVIAMKDPMDFYVIDDLELSTRLTISPVIASKNDIIVAINKYYFKDDKGANIRIGGDTEEASVIQLLDQILKNAIQLRASDIHIDPHEDNVYVRFRIDGRLQTENLLPKQMQNSLIARIKILANLNITQTRLPQDGRIKTMLDTSHVDLRISCLPTVYGEKVVIRILDLKNALMQINELNLSEENYHNYRKLISQPSGLVLLTGPTGSGKTSTLYASLNHLNREHVNIITVEDPVEFQLKGINQVQVNSPVGLTFANGLRSILRQDPNIIMVGEIRDQETAEIAIRASLTGHLVFSTLHTNSAMDTVPRLIDMGVEPYLVVLAIKGIVAQRLVRKICRDCLEQREATEMEKEIFRNNGMQSDYVSYGKGCSSCHQQGYRGRLAVHEVLVLDETLKSMLLNRCSMKEIKDYATNHGMKLLIQDGLEKVKSGITTMDEIMQISISI